MSTSAQSAQRRVAAHFAKRPVTPDRSFEREMASWMAETHSREERLAIYQRFAGQDSPFDRMNRRIALRSLLAAMGDDVSIGTNVVFVHPETIELGDGVCLGAGAMVQGRHDGRCTIGKRCWIGPHAYLDARDLVMEDFVGWGPGAKILGSEHVGEPSDVTVLETDLLISPVRIRRGADVGTNAVVMPGVTVGLGAIVGAGAVVTRDVEDYAIVAGVPARPLKSRRK
jgi:acetyltransferase-like isoleucine patch superfamily enzyme